MVLVWVVTRLSCKSIFVANLRMCLPRFVGILLRETGNKYITLYMCIYIYN